MKKYCLAAALSMAFLAPAAHADTLLGLYVGVDGWQSDNSGSFSDSGNMQDFNFEDETFISYYAALEHPIPLVPNIKLKYTELELNGSTLLNETFEFGGTSFTTNTTATTISDLSHVDYILYYEIFDNDLLSFDFGLTARDFDGDVTLAAQITTDSGTTTQSDSIAVTDIVPMLYVATNVGLPLTGLNLYAQGNFLSFDDHTLYDYEVGVSYELIDNLAVDMNINLGYRAVKLELEDLNDLYTNIEFDGVFIGTTIHF